MSMTQSRRHFLTSLSLAGAASFLRAPPAPAAEGTLETTTVRLVNDGSICIAPEYAAEELLRAEGFTDIRYVEVPSAKQIEGLASGVVDFVLSFRLLISRRSTPAFRSRCSPACMSAALSCSPRKASAASAS
jgi:NitT/TauT family transport system substrate-binding protein